MKLSCSYNFFNGEEHLISSLKSVRNNVDYITLVYQTISNRGNPISEAALDAITTARNEKLLDDVYQYGPDLNRTATHNETEKRRIGLELAKTNKCTHFFTMDADEFYYEHELSDAKKYIIKNNLLRTFCYSFMHLTSPRFRCLDTTKVCFIHAINAGSRVGKYPCPVPDIDSTRIIHTPQGVIARLLAKKHHLFSPGQVAMYHMNFVRADKLQSKLSNTSTEDTDFLEKIRKNIDEWKPGDIFHFPGKGNFTFTQVNNDFNTFDPYEDEAHISVTS